MPVRKVLKFPKISPYLTRFSSLPEKLENKIPLEIYRNANWKFWLN